MKWVAGLLLVANVVLYLWAEGGGAGIDRAGLVAPDVNKEGMPLLREIQAETGEDAVNQPVAAPKNPDSTGAEQAALSCYRIGPFREEAGWLAANRWMATQKFPYNAVRSESREMRAVRVFLGPFDSAAAESMMNWLKEKEIDHYADRKAPEEVRISLGYFTQEELAAKFVAHLLSRGIEANSQAEYRAIGPFDWMETAIDTRRRDSLLSRRWHGDGVAVLEVDCRAISLPAKTDANTGG